jgi:hypothetical protein
MLLSPLLRVVAYLFLKLKLGLLSFDASSRFHAHVELTSK